MKAIKSLSEIIDTMIKYRNKSKEEPLSLAENFLCITSYFNRSNWK